MAPCTMRVSTEYRTPAEIADIPWVVSGFPRDCDIPWTGWAGAACLGCSAGNEGWPLRARVVRVSDQAAGRARSAIKVVTSNRSRDCEPLGQLAGKEGSREALIADAAGRLPTGWLHRVHHS